MRRLPVYLLLDTSGSMKGDPIESVKVGLGAMLSSLRQDPFSLESVFLSIITFDRHVKILTPLTALEDLAIPKLVTPESGPTHLGKALETLCTQVKKEVVLSTEQQKGDWRPLLFLMTDGSPSDVQLYKNIVPVVRAQKFGTIVACAAGAKAKIQSLKELTDNVVSLDTMDSTSFMQFFKWVTVSIGSGNMSMGATAEVKLPPPPPEVQIVI